MNASFSLAQQVKLAVLNHLLWVVHNPLNIVSNSVYVVGLFSAIETT